MRKFLKLFFHIGLVGVAVLPVLITVALVYFNWPARGVEENKSSALGVTFSYRYARDIGLDWKETYMAMLEDLKIKKIRLPVYWDLVEKEENHYDFADVDWQIEQAEKNKAEIILVVGQKVPRWPECFIPEWVKDDDEKRKERLLLFVGNVVDRYKNSPSVAHWQVENEPFLKFGICPKLDIDLLDREIELVKIKDPTRKIIITDSGELSIWHLAAKRADIFGTTMYLDVCSKFVGCFTYPIGPNFFKFKQGIIKIFSKQNNAIVIELQAEPWLDGWTIHKSLGEQLTAMDGKRLKKHVAFAERSGFSEIYLWGVEWWYWLKVFQNHPELWDTARELFNGRIR